MSTVPTTPDPSPAPVFDPYRLNGYVQALGYHVAGPVDPEETCIDRLVYVEQLLSNLLDAYVVVAATSTAYHSLVQQATEALTHLHEGI